MGNSCCYVTSNEPNFAEKRYLLRTLNNCTTSNGSEAAVKEFVKRLESGGLPIQVVLQNGNNMACTLGLEMHANSLLIRSGDKMRKVPFNTIRNVLATPQQLSRVETQRDIANEPLAVGLHIHKSESCIPLLMETEADKHNFVEMLKTFGIPPPKPKKPDASGPAS